MNIFAKTNYRQILSDSVEERKQRDPKANFQQMALYCRMPKSYLSKVIHGNAELNSDQLYLICEFLNFDEAETRFMHLLLEYSRCGLKKRKEKLLEQIYVQQNQNLAIKKNIQMPTLPESNIHIVSYYLDPKMQLIHMALTIEKYRKNPKLLLAALGIRPDHLLSCLNQLEKMQLIEQNRDEIKILADKLHLPKHSPLYRAWRNQIKLHAINRSDSLDEHQDHSFSVLFSSDASTYAEIQSLFLVFLKKVEAMVECSEKLGVYQLSFDMFPWLSP